MLQTGALAAQQHRTFAAMLSDNTKSIRQGVTADLAAAEWQRSSVLCRTA